MSESPKRFMPISLIIAWLVPVIALFSAGFVLWSVAMGTTGMGDGVDRLIYPALYLWLALPVVGLWAAFASLRNKTKTIRIFAGIAFVLNAIYFGFAAFLGIVNLLGKFAG